MTAKPKSPKHLTADLQRWFAYYTAEYDMDPAERQILEMMADCWTDYRGLRNALATAKSHTCRSRLRAY